VTEAPKIAAAYPEYFIAWGSADLEILLRNGRLTHIFFLSPPDLHMEQLTYCLKRLDTADHTIYLFVEKPTDFYPNRIRDAMSFFAMMANREQVVVRQIDHYVEKWSVRRLVERFAEVPKIVGKLREIIFFSAEKQLIPPSPTYAKGYAIEHGVHAWSILSRLFPGILTVPVYLDNAKRLHRAWRYKGVSSYCQGDTAFLFRFIAHPSSKLRDALIPETRIIIGGGKALGIDKKVLILRGEDGDIAADLSNDRVVSTIRGLKRDLFKDDPAPRIPAYRVIMEGIFGDNPIPLKVTLPLETGLWALEKMYEGINALESMEDYEAGTTPDEFNHLVFGLDHS
jgi:hypothetical protein